MSNSNFLSCQRDAINLHKKLCDSKNIQSCGDTVLTIETQKGQCSEGQLGPLASASDDKDYAMAQPWVLFSLSFS